MQKNVGMWDRVGRLVMAVALGTCAVVAPLPLMVRLLTFGLGAGYMLATAVSARCLGYRLMGRSTCPVTFRP